MAKVTVRIHLPRLDLQFWGEKTLDKLASKIGNPIRTDKMKATKGRVSYAHILIDIDADKELVEHFCFKGPDGRVYNPKVEYEWRPIRCNQCLMWGHLKEACRSAVPKQIWVPKKLPEASKVGIQENIVEKKQLLPQTDNGDAWQLNKGKACLNKPGMTEAADVPGNRFECLLVATVRYSRKRS